MCLNGTANNVFYVLFFAVETVDAVTDKTWDDELMKGPNGEVVMGEVMKNQETTSSDMPVRISRCIV